MSEKTILSVAVTGNQTTVQQHAGLPCTPEQIATACIDSAKAGAAITHIHVRYPDGSPSMELSHYKEVVDRIRDSNVDVIINLNNWTRATLRSKCRRSEGGCAGHHADEPDAARRAHHRSETRNLQP